MRNLAGQTTAHANAYIEDELTEACIPIVRQDHPFSREVPASLIGEAGAYRFERAWYYWVVTGRVPVALARELYADPRGRRDVRVAGHCGCPEPVDPWIEVIDGEQYVTMYHIDSQDGLNLFAEKVIGCRPLPPTEAEKKAALEIARVNPSGSVIYEDDLTEQDYLDAQREIQGIRSDLVELRSRLDRLSRGADRGMIPSDSLAGKVSSSLTVALMALYDLEDPASTRSFASRAERTKQLWDDIYENPTRYVLRESRPS